jgi:processive 1,2-diacylglycerol beta-glucosyltransferase
MVTDERPRAPASGGPARPGALILSGSIGKGHDSVAEATRRALSTSELRAEVLDCMSLLGGTGARLGTSVFRRMISVPAVYDGFHFSYLRNGTWLPRALERTAVRQVLPAVRTAVEKVGGSPLVVSVFPTGVSAAGALKQERPELTTVAICTDACAHRMWVADGTDLYVVCSSLAALTVRRYAPAAAIEVVPPPVRPQFYDAPDRRGAREALGVPLGVPCVLLMAGGWGLGPLAETAETLASAGYVVLAVAGTNAALHARLRALARRTSRVVPFAMTDRVPELMAAADAVVTSAGQTCHEARVVGRWLVVLDVVPGHGRENTLHELEQGGALSCSPDPESVRDAVGVLFREEPEHPPWPVASAAEWDKHFFGALSRIGVDVGSDRPPGAHHQVVGAPDRGDRARDPKVSGASADGVGTRVGGEPVGAR